MLQEIGYYRYVLAADLNGPLYGTGKYYEKRQKYIESLKREVTQIKILSFGGFQWINVDESDLV